MTNDQDLSPLKVLVVEDEQMVAMLVEDMLCELGYEVAAVAANLQAGLKAAEQGQVDLAVVDVNLNGVSSFPIADLLLRNGTPFVFASGYGLPGVKEAYPGVPVLQKPFLQSALAEALNDRTRAIESGPPSRKAEDA